MHTVAVTTITTAAVAAVGVFVASFFITAPGAKIGEESVAWRTPSSLEEELNERLDDLAIHVEDVTYSPKELGIGLDSDALAQDLNGLKVIPGGINPTLTRLPLQINEVDLTAKLHEDNPEVFYSPTDSTVSFSDGRWHATESKPGVTLSMEKLAKGVEKALLHRDSSVKFNEAMAQEIEPAISSEVTESLASKANAMIETAGVYSGDTKLMSLSSEQLDQWVSFSTSEAGEIAVTIDEAGVRDFYRTLPTELNKSPVDGVAVTDETGKRIHTLEAWADGYKLTSDYDADLQKTIESLRSLSNAHFSVKGEVLAANVTDLYRRVEVDLAARKVMTYENDTLMKTYPMAVGKPNTPTYAGEFRVGWQTQMQDMGCVPGVDYCTENVKWVSYFNGDQAFHGTYWHNDFGNPNASARSHGCVNMTEADAYELYKFVQAGTPVSVY